MSDLAVLAVGAMLGILAVLAARGQPRSSARRPVRPAGSRLVHHPGSPRGRSTAVRWVVVVAALGLMAIASPAMAIVAAAVSVGWLATESRRTDRQRRRAVTAALPEALDLVIVCVEAGHLPIDAMRLLHPVLPAVLGRPFAEVVARVDRGDRFATALSELPRQLGPASLTFVDALVQTDRAGLAFGPAVERLAGDARHHRRRAAEASARELPVRLSFPLVLCTLPSFVLVAIVPLLVGALSSVQVG